MQERKLNGHAAKALREALGIPGGEFAVACGMSHGQLSNIEADRKPASADVIDNLVGAQTCARRNAHFGGRIIASAWRRAIPT